MVRVLSFFSDATKGLQTPGLDHLPSSSGRRSEFSGNFLCSFFLFRKVKKNIPVCLSLSALLSVQSVCIVI